ncbi:MAG: formylglycine-generating enzyme family protein [Rhodospirillaceae bacterium]|nr:formylglycine-generating enzyme family protein [Rhodospirillaceae bacterium]
MTQLTVASAITFAVSACTADGAKTKPVAGAVFRDCRDCPEMIIVPAGNALIGSLESEVGRLPNEGPQHEVRIARPFAISKFEVTRGQYAAFVRETGRVSSTRCVVWTGARGGEAVDGKSWQDPNFPQTDDHPVVCITWTDANDYVNWLRGKTGKPYRFLSEAEWEYAARAGTTTRYSFGDDAKDICKFANVPDQSAKDSVRGSPWLYTDCTDGYGVQTSPVGTFAPNAFGLHDMHGNLWEWTEDCYSDTFTGAPTDGSAWMAAPCHRRAVRGGSLSAPVQNSRSASRYKGVLEGRGDEKLENSLIYQNFNLGLRVGLSLN